MITNKAIAIGNKVLPRPLIQGGMGIGVSRCRLAGAVAQNGGMGVLSTAQIGYDHPDFPRDPEGCNLRVLPQQIQRAKALSGGNGLIGVNIMSVTQLYGDYVKTACEAGVDAIISGAGLPLELPKFAADYDVALAPIVSTAKSADVILKYWDRRYHCTADFLVVEGPKAGGHLGFSRDELENIENLDYDTEIQNILACRARFAEKYGTEIPVFIAGGIFTPEDVTRALSLGADGVQVASLFVATEECDASEAYKQAYIQAKPEDIVILQSPVGMPGRAVKNAFVEQVLTAPPKIQKCFNCLRACDPATAPYCITQALIHAVQGDLEHGLIFCGARTGEIQKISTVAAVMDHLLGSPVISQESA